MAAPMDVMARLAIFAAILVLLASMTQAERDMCEAVSHHARRDCGYIGITEVACVEGGSCCYDESIPNVPHCFYGDCMLEERRDCGYPGITEKDCVRGGLCCYDDSVTAANHCFFDATVPTSISESARCPNPDMDIGRPCAADTDPNIAEEKCYALGCCYNRANKRCYSVPQVCFAYFAVVPEPYYTILTPQGNTTYSHTWVVSDHPSVTFRLRTCEQGLMVLTEMPWRTDTNALEISIAKDSIVLRDKVTGNELENAPTPSDWLGCDFPRAIWLSWENDVVELGGGDMIGEDIKLSYSLPEGNYMFMPTGYSFSSSDISPQGATWEVPRKEVQSMFAETSRENSDKNLEVNENDHVVFGVRSCYEVKLALSRKNGSTGEIIEINLSPSGLSSMNKNKLLLAQAETRGLFHCHVTTFIWVKWTNTMIEVGRGMQVGDEMFMRAAGRFDIELSVLTITSRTSPASYVMHGFEVNSFKLLAVNNLADENAYKVNIQNKETFVFRVRACKNAVLELKARPGPDGVQPDYVRIVIGDQDNVMTNIVYLDDNGDMKDIDGVSTEKILSCYNMRYLWISWKESKFRLGTGSIVFENQVFERSDKHAPRPAFQWLHLVSLDETDLSTWQFDEYQGNAVVLPTAFPSHGDDSMVSYTVEGRSSLVFKLRGDHDATLSLGHYFAFNYGNRYLVDIGTIKGDNTMYCSISRTNGSTIEETRTPDIISAKVPRHFWVSWYGGHIELGRGSVVGELAILSMVHKDMFEINAVHLSGGTHVEWTLNVLEVDRYSIHTSTAPSDNSYEDNWLSTHLHIFPFMVRSPNPVSIVLTKTPYENNNLEITFGIRDNTYTSVQFIGTNTTYFEAPSLNVLSDFELVPLWFMYHDNTLNVGSGDFRYENIFLVYDVDNYLHEKFEYTGVILNNGATSPVEWSILPETVNLVKKKTPATYGHRFLWRSLGLVSSLVFKVRAGADAHILLSPAIEETDNDVIELTLGYNNNQMTILRIGSKATDGIILMSTPTPNVLSDQEDRTFWVSWLGGEIRLGKGDHVGVDPLIDWTLPEPLPIHAISMCTSSTVGHWEVSEVLGDLYHISTPPIGDWTKWEYFQLYSGKTFLQFGVVTCTSAHLLLLHSGSLESHNFEVVIGENMTDTAKLYKVQEFTQLEELATSTVPGVVSCGFEEIFWLSWERKMIRFGKGNYPSKILFEYEYTDYITLNSISLGSGNDGQINVPTLWQIRPNTIERLAVHTVGPKNYNQFWGSSSSLNYLRFQVTANGNISIVISNAPQVVSVNDYEFTIHQQGETDSLSISKSGSLKHRKSVESLKLSDEKRYLWVSWKGSEISLGVGVDVGSGALITWVDERPLDINFFSVASIEPSTWAEWYFYNTQGNVYEAFTPDTEDYPANYHRVWFAPVNFSTHFQFNVRACQNARMALIENPTDLCSKGEVYQVILDTIDEETGKRYSAIRAAINGTNKSIKEDDDPDPVVSCNAVSDLWVDWHDGVKVGRGEWPGDQFMDYTPVARRFAPNIIAMSTGPGSNGNWIFPFEQAEVVFVNISRNARTPMAKVYDYFWMGIHGRTSVVFSVKLAKYALVQLSQVAFQGGEEAYELEMDRTDGCTVIRGPDGFEVAKRNLPNLLSGDMYKAFWLGWDSGTLSFGAGGLPYSNRLLSAPIGSETQFSTLGVASGTAMGGGEWSFLRSRGKVYRVKTEGGNSEPPMFLVVQRDFVTFQVRACSDATLMLIGTPETIWVDNLEIVIGAFMNTKIEIRHASRDDTVASELFPNLLDCNALRPFWVSWKDGVIRVGSGTDLSRDLLSWVFTDTYSGATPAFAIGAVVPLTPAADGEWEFDFHQPRVEDQFTKLHSTSDGKRSSCTSSSFINSTFLSQCMDLASESGSQVFQHRQDQCELLQCDRGVRETQAVDTDDIQGYDIYITETNRTDETYFAYTGKKYHYEQHWISVTGQMNMTFEVDATNDVHLALVAIPANTRTLAYEIVIGASGNQESKIRPKVGALVNAIKKEDTPHILKGGIFRPFWISWYDNEISAGRGRVIGLEPFIRWVPDEPIHVVNSIGISTGGNSKGRWLFGNFDTGLNLPRDEKEDVYIIETGEDKKYLTHFIPANNFMVFAIQACSDAFVSVNAVPNHPEVEAFVVGIGTNNNQEVSISITGSSQQPQVKPLKDVLDCNNTRRFWVMWGVDVVALGKVSSDNPIGERPLVQIHQLEMPIIHSVSITTATWGIWQVSKSLAFYTQTTTQPAAEPTFSEFWVNIETTSDLVFSVKACSGVHLKIGYDKEEPKNTYLVDIGTDHNVKSMIRDGSNGDILAETISTGILDCDSFHWFWVHWYQGLAVGEGRTPGARSILQTGVTYPVRSLAFSTDYNQKGLFRIDDIDDDSFYVVTPGDNTFQHAWVSSQSSAMTFKIRACTGAIIRLTANFLDADPNKGGYEVIIDNGVSMIRRIPSYTQLTNATTTNLVQCELFTELQLSWEGGEVALLQDNQDVMRASDPMFISVNALSFAAINTGNDAVAWKFPRHSGEDTVLITPQTSQGFDKWVTTSETFIFFKIQAASDAIIRACQYIGVMGFDCYDISLQIPSAASPSVCTSHIKSYSGADNTEATHSGCNLLSSQKSAQFWLSWQNDIVEIGQGSTVGYETLMSWDASSSQYKHPVNAIGMMTFTTKGYWEFSEVEDKVFEVKMLAYDPPSAPRYTTWLRMDETHLNFKLKGCERAVIVLSQTPDDLGGNRYKIEIEKVYTKVYKVPEQGLTAILAQVNTTGLLSCDRFKDYRLSWTAPWLDAQSLVLEEVLGDIKVEVNDEFSSWSIHAVTIITTETNLLYWSFKDNAAAAISFETQGDKDSEQVVYKSSHKQHFQFKLKGKGPAHVILQEHYHTDNLYEFFIGIEGNQKTAIKAAASTTYDVITNTPDILSEEEFRQFWVSWTGHSVAIGSGYIHGVSQILFLLTGNKPINAQYVALTTSNNNNGTWEVSQYPADLVMIGMGAVSVSNPLVSYQMADTQTGAVFEVKTCEGFTVSLHPRKSDPASYKIEAKYRVLSIYRHAAQVHTVTLSRDVEVCTEYRRFYVGWKDGDIHLAGDAEGGWRYIDWKDSDPLEVHVVKVPEDGHVAKWLLPRYLGSAVEVIQAKPTSVHFPFQNVWYTLSGRTGLVFGVKSESGGAVLFTRTPGIFTHDGYELRLSKSNTTLHDRLTGEVVLWKETPGIVNSYVFSYFWSQWDGGLLRIGNGVAPGISQILAYNMTPGYDIFAAAFDHHDDVIWSFDQDSGNEFIVETSEDAAFDHAWFALKENVFRFSVKSFQQAGVRLYVQPEYKEPHYTDLIFGTLDNTAFAIVENGNVSTAEIISGFGTLDRDEYRPFWLVLEDNKLKVGSGHSLEGKFYEKPYIHRISTVSLGDDSVSSASWKIPQDQEVMARFRTPATELFNTHWISLVGYSSAILRIQGCDGAEILLFSVFKNQGLPSTRIIIDKAGVSSIIDVNDKNHSVSTPNLLSCDEPRAVWVTWFDRVAFGTGATVGSNELLSVNEPMHLVVSMGLASGIANKTTSATWDIYRLKGNVFYENVEPDNPAKGVMVGPSDPSAFYVFGSVRSCGGATVGLNTILSDEGVALNIVYGSEGNTQSEIIRGETNVAKASTPYFMNTMIDQLFWVFFGNSTVYSGLGIAPPFIPILTYVDPDTSRFQFMTFTAGQDNTCPAKWMVDIRPDDKLALLTSKQFSPDSTVISVMDASVILLNIKAKHSANIALHVIPGNVKYLTWEIAIQEFLSGKTCIREGVGSPNSVCYDPKLLNGDEFRKFWVYWGGMTLSFGTGWAPSDETRVVYLTSNIRPPFAMVSFASYGNAEVAWEVFMTNITYKGSTTTSAKPESSTTTATPKVTTTSTTTTTARSSPIASEATGPTSATSPSPGPESTTTTLTPATTTAGVIGGDVSGGLTAGALVGVIFGSILLVGILVFVGLLLLARLRPTALPFRPPGPVFINSAYSDIDGNNDQIPMEQTVPGHVQEYKDNVEGGDVDA